MQQHVHWVGVDSEGPRALQLFISVAARQHADPQRAFASGGQQVPNTIAYDDTVAQRDFKALRCSNEYVWRGLGFLYIGGQNCRFGRDIELLEQERGLLAIAGGGNSNSDLCAVKMPEQVVCAAQGGNLRERLDKFSIVLFFK